MASYNSGSSCGKCSKTLKNVTGLFQHTADKHGYPFSCTVCYQMIKFQSEMWEHVKLHNLPRSFGGKRRQKRKPKKIFNIAASEVLYHLPDRVSEMSFSERSNLHTLTSRDNLDKFVNDYVQPDDAYLSSCNAVVDRLVKFLQNSLPERYRPSRIIKGGSLGKGTAVKDISDIDLILFLSQSRFPTVRHVKSQMDDILAEFIRYLSTYGECMYPQQKAKAVQVTLSCHAGHTHDVDVLPACDLDLRTSDERRLVYKKIKQEDGDIAEYYVPSLSPLQIDFIKSERPTKLKTLIRLVKFWVKTYVENPPSSLLFELITIKLWENTGQPENFDLRRGFYGVLYCIKNYQTIEAEWFCYYSETLARSLVSHKRPYVIDPDNPFCELMCKYRNWSQLQSESEYFLQKPLFQGISGRISNWRM